MIQLANLLKAVREQGSTVYVLGNGGSEAIAQHLVLHLRNCNIRACDLMADTVWMTAQSNDHAYETAPMGLLKLLAHPRDMLLVISGSGNSKNVVAAAKVAMTEAVSAVGILGNNGGKVAKYCAFEIALPGLDYGPLEDCFSAIIHVLCEDLKSTTVSCRLKAAVSTHRRL